MRHLVVSEYGSYLSRKSQRLVVKHNGKVIDEIPFFQLEQVTLEGHGISISTDLVHEMAEAGVQINFLTRSGRPYAKIISPALSASVNIRRQQIISYSGPKGAEFVHLIVSAKMTNQINLLRYFLKYRRKKADSSYSQIQELVQKMKSLATALPKVGEQSNLDDLRSLFLITEAKVGRLYWQGVKFLLKDKIDFSGRVHGGARDPLNCALNYGYGFLYSRVWGAVVLAGLEPFAGFLHVDRPGKPSLVLDLVEEFRQPVVDRMLIAQVNKGRTYRVDEKGLVETDRHLLAQDFLQEFERRVHFEGKMHKVGNIIQLQARNFASFLRNQKKYRPFLMKW